MAYTPVGPKRKPVYGKTRAEAAEKLAQALTNREGSRFTFDAKNLTVGGYLTRWLEDSVQGSVKPITYESWPGAELRRAQVLHSGTIWLSESGLSLSRVTPPPSL